MPREKDNTGAGPGKPPQLSLILRLLGGGYLLYLAWGLLTEAEGRLYTAAGVVFAAAGAALVFFSGRSLLRGDFKRPGDPPGEPAEDPEEPADIGKED